MIDLGLIPNINLYNKLEAYQYGSAIALVFQTQDLFYLWGNISL